jgi:hypothetical protein
MKLTDNVESRRIRVEIREVLLKYWDPIGIKDEPRAQDEYDVYIGGVFALLTTNVSEEELKAHLWKIIEERIEIHPPAGATDKTVAARKAIKLRTESA